MGGTEGRDMTQDEAGEWINWAGGACPVGPFVMVAVRLRDGVVRPARRGFEWVWSRYGLPVEDIVAYRVVNP